MFLGVFTVQIENLHISIYGLIDL